MVFGAIGFKFVGSICIENYISSYKPVKCKNNVKMASILRIATQSDSQM